MILFTQRIYSTLLTSSEGKFQTLVGLEVWKAIFSDSVTAGITEMNLDKSNVSLTVKWFGSKMSP